MNDPIQDIIDRWRIVFDRSFKEKNRAFCMQVHDWAFGAYSALLHIDKAASDRIEALHKEFWAKIESM